jgi:hypothetical protein
LRSTDDEDSEPIAPHRPPMVDERTVAPPPPPDSIEAGLAMGAFAAAAGARALEATQTAAAVSDPAVRENPAKRARTRRAATPKTPELVRTPRTPRTPKT